MSFSTISLIAFAVISALLAVSKRTRPLIIALTILWLAVVATYDFTNNEVVSGLMLLVVAAGIGFGAVRDRKKLIAQIKG
ncbi:hypothetical protein GCM10018980_39970 [Streptomyces capoamus]|uniref:Uncharacterized protein n=1 Tax=Streptomyces capoamus TaxID=68183 RepID=A0A919C6Q2_9ACTN|nr:hypothetical protein [Streptomyces capoamus]GGW15191.1 hypothetical protein GCM10010501_26220 [Streptomyces libani subsp. rufus]GHG54926.1 hypothetical protein GCM10018980_39970 [Streptomyces capoamus]